MKNFTLSLLGFVMIFSVLSVDLSAEPMSITTSTAAAQVTPLEDEPDDAPGLGSIVGSPEAGPKPEDAGDRGGYAQLGLALVLVGAVGFIGLRIVRETRGRDNTPTRDTL